MIDTQLAEQIREIVRAELAPMRVQLDGLAPMRAQLDGLRAELAPMRAQLDGLPLINRTVTVIQQEVRALRGAFNDFALTNPTTGEIEALHTDVNRVQAENAELTARVMTLERLVRELGAMKS
jgi:Tfp pilus assembly protein PilO